MDKSTDILDIGNAIVKSVQLYVRRECLCKEVLALQWDLLAIVDLPSVICFGHNTDDGHVD